MSGSVRQIAFSAICAFGASTFFATAADAQALRAETTEVAAAATQSSAAACIQALDRPVVDPALLVRRCTGYIDTAIASPGNASPGEEAAAHLVRATAYRDLGDEPHARADDQEAIRLYTSVIDTYEPYPEFVFRRGTAYHALGDVHNALRDYDTAIKRNPWNVTAFADRGILLARYDNQYNLATADFDQALKLAPDNEKILILRGDAYAAQGKYTEALTDLDRAVEIAPRDPEAYTHRASAYGRKGVTDAALRDYEKALSIYPDDFDALLSRAALYSESGDGASAVADMNHALAVRPGNASALYNRGYAYFVERKYDAAIRDYTAAIDATPDFGMAYTNRCLNAALAGRDKTSTLADCDAAIRLLPARADVRETRGFVDLKYGDNETAIADYDAALKTDPNRPLALYGRGIAHQRKGDTQAGTADKQAARALYTNIDREFAPYGVE
jgi:tetratricopeptide (TPR) repeat protein